MRYLVRVPLYSYNEKITPEILREIDVTRIELHWTGKTYRVDAENGKAFYLYYIGLPNQNPFEVISGYGSGRYGLNLVFGDFLGNLISTCRADGQDLSVAVEDIGFFDSMPYVDLYLYVVTNSASVCNSVNRRFQIACNETKSTIDGVLVSTPVGIPYVVRKTYLEEETTSTKEENKKKEGKETMANLFGNIKVGKAGSKYSLTYFGTIAYNGKSYYQGKIFDATGMTINFDMLYLVPSMEVKAGDIVDKDGKAYYVLGVNNGVVKAIDLEGGTEENLVPGGPFGITMYSKVFNPMGNMQGENAFGNMLMMQALMGNDNRSDGNGMLLAMMMMQGGFKLPTFEMPKMPEVGGEKIAENK